MSRLIDADALNKMRFSEGINNEGILYVPYCEVMQNIRNAPTAFDVEKVVEELKRKSRIMMPVIPTEEAIDIVRKGGIE